MLTIFGSINIDQVVRVATIPTPGETVLGERVADTHGGKGANQAVAAARAGRGDVAVTMIGAVGDDAHGDAAMENFFANKVVPEVQKIPSSTTGTALITLSNDGENTITVISGANAHLSHTHLTSETLERTSVLLCQGEVGLKETVYAMAAVRAANADATILLNLAPVPACGNPHIVNEALNFCDILIVNETESEALSSILKPDESTRLPMIAQQHECSIIVTRGPKGAELITPSGEKNQVPTPHIDPIDTTGAGDTFCGVVAILLAEGSDILPAIALACNAAAKACGDVGAQAAMPQRPDFLKDRIPS